MIIDIPDWAMIGTFVLVKDTGLYRGDDKNKWYKEKIIAYGYDGFFHQAHNCPVYFSHFSDYGKTIKLEECYLMGGISK